VAENQDKSSKTEEPTEKKLRDARKRGDVPASRETGNLMVVVSLFGVTAFLLPLQTASLVASLSRLLEGAGQIEVGAGNSGSAQLGDVFRSLVYDLSTALYPMVLVLVGGAIFGIIVRGETVIAFDRIKPKFSRVSPMQGLKRLFSADTLVEFGKNLVKVAAVGALGFWIGRGAVEQVWLVPGLFPERLPGLMQEASARMLGAVGALLVPIAVLDIIWRRFEWRRKLRMSVKEIRDEFKESEGSPEIKSRRAAIRRSRARQRLAAAVPTASVVLTNPTHFAVALKYERGSDQAPVCVAKGADAVARRIRSLAFENDVPVIENKPLTRSLFQVLEVGDEVPVDHWEAVAKIIGFVIALEEHRRADPPEGSVLKTTPD